MHQPNPDRLHSLRAALREIPLDGFVLPRGDEHLGEYVAAGSERLAWLTGFTGSAGLAVVLDDEAAVFSDGRYVLQLEAQTDPSLWQRAHLIEQPPERWLAARTGPGSGSGSGRRIGYDPWLMSRDQLARYEALGIVMVPLSPNPVDGIWHDRPPAPLETVSPHELIFAGEASAEKREQIACVLREAGEDCAILTDPASIAWLLNIRGHDVPFTPLALGFALLEASGAVTLFMDPRKIPAETRAWLGNGVRLEAPDRLDAAIRDLSGRKVRLDAGGSAVWFAQRLQQAGAQISVGADPCLLPKARKSQVEQEGARRAHRLDGVALCRFLHWLDAHGVGALESEAASVLDSFRARAPEYRGESFPAISGAGPNGAIIHYRVTPETDRRLAADEIYLIDSGGQYPFGTTDVTRTVWTGPATPPAAAREHYTRVLLGHLALARARFPAGTTGQRLDSLARAPLWQAGLDYDHGTGHGIGNYLAVHEGPCSIHPRAQPVAVEAGMILSDEPGFYLPGAYGMRVENLLLARAADVPRATRTFLEFETLTLAPFERRLIAPALLSPLERGWIDDYHAHVLAEIGSVLDDEARAWLGQACATLNAD